MSKLSRKSILRSGLIVFCLSMTAVLFNNCSKQTDGALVLQSTAPSIDDNSNSGSDASGTLCEQDIKNLYARGWHKFLATNCAICHSSGPGKGRFANGDLNLAYDEFMNVGFAKVAANATAATHNAPYSGVQHTQAVNELKVEWLKGLQDLAICSGDTSNLPTETQLQKMSMVSTQQITGLQKDGDSKVLAWTLNTDLRRTVGDAATPNLPGAKIGIKVTRLKNASGSTYYTFTSPTLYGSTEDARLQGLFILINGRALNYPSTFSYVDKNIRKGSANDLSGLISTGSLVAPKVIVPTDTISLGFIDITKVVLPPLPPPIAVNIEGSQVVIVPSGRQFIDLTLRLSSAASEPVVVTVSEKNALCDKAITADNINKEFKIASATCLPEILAAVCPGGACGDAVKTFGRARSDIGATFKRFDWDFKFPTNAVTFSEGETVKTLRIEFSRDIRLEKNRLLTFDIADVLGSVNVGSNKSVTYVINKYNNPVPNGNILTFSELMAPGSGVLGKNCVKCHNSTLSAGGYDMTNYDLMIQRGVLVPGNVNSKMYVRTHPTPEFLAKPMPQDGFLPQDEVIEIERWILDGAKNN